MIKKILKTIFSLGLLTPWIFLLWVALSNDARPINIAYILDAIVRAGILIGLMFATWLGVNILKDTWKL